MWQQFAVWPTVLLPALIPFALSRGASCVVQAVYEVEPEHVVQCLLDAVWTFHDQSQLALTLLLDRGHSNRDLSALFLDDAGPCADVAVAMHFALKCPFEQVRRRAWAALRQLGTSALVPQIVIEDDSDAAILTVAHLLSGDDVFLPESYLRHPAIQVALLRQRAVVPAQLAFDVSSPDVLLAGMQRGAFDFVWSPRVLHRLLSDAPYAAALAPLIDRAGEEDMLAVLVERLPRMDRRDAGAALGRYAPRPLAVGFFTELLGLAAGDAFAESFLLSYFDEPVDEGEFVVARALCLAEQVLQSCGLGDALVGKLSQHCLLYHTQ